jgi:hypothetical protein
VFFPRRLDRRSVFDLTHNGISVAQFQKAFTKIYLPFVSSRCEVLIFRRRAKFDKDLKICIDVITVFTATIMHESLMSIYIFPKCVLCNFTRLINFDVHLFYGL